MTRFKLKGNKQNMLALRVKKQISIAGEMRIVDDKIHLYGDTEYDSESLPQSFRCEKLSYENIKTQLGDNIIWEKEKEVKEVSNDNDKPPRPGKPEDKKDKEKKE